VRGRPAWVVGVLLALLSLLSLPACSGGGGGDDAGEGGGAARAPGELRVAVAEDIWPLTGRGPTSKAFAAGEVNVNVYEPLVSLAPDFTVEPGLAERWELVDERTWRFHLRRGVTFHDGRPFTADDVVWSWGSRELYPRAVVSTLAPGGVVKVDDHTVDFRTAVTNHRLPEQLTHPEGPILPAGGHSDDDPPVGTGPYRVVEYRPRQRVVVERYDGYWGRKAAVARLTFVFEPEPEARVEAVRDGEVDVAASLPHAAAAGGGLAPARAVRAPIGATHQLSFNLTGAAPSAVAADRAVRLAVSLALDRAAYVAEVLGGIGEPGRWMSPPVVLGEAASLVDPPVHDPDRGRRVLDETGWVAGPDGVRHKGAQRLTLTLLGGPAVPEEGLRFIQRALQAVGIEVAVKKAADTVTVNQFRDVGYDAELGLPNQNDANPAFLVAGRADALPGRPDVAAAVAAAHEHPSRRGAQEAAARAMHVIVVEEAAVVPLAAVPRVYGLRAGVELREVHPSAVNQSWAALATS
jgi:peptide/nickel transport system substrate-binding protein